MTKSEVEMTNGGDGEVNRRGRQVRRTNDEVAARRTERCEPPRAPRTPRQGQRLGERGYDRESGGGEVRDWPEEARTGIHI